MSDGQERYVFAATVDDKGRIRPDEVNVTAGRLTKWKGRHVNVTVSRYVKSKTNPQLATYFGPVLDAWSDFTGYTKDEMDRELRLAYLKPQWAVSKLTGEELIEFPRLSTLNAEQMSEYLDRVLREGRSMGIQFAFDSDPTVLNSLSSEQGEMSLPDGSETVTRQKNEG